MRRFAQVFRDEPQSEHDESEAAAAAAEEDYAHDENSAAHYSENEQGREHEEFAVEHGVQRGEAEADWAALNSSRPMPAPSAAELFEQQQHSWDELNAYHRQQQQEQEQEQPDDVYTADDQHQQHFEQYHQHQPDEDADQFDEAHAAVLEMHQEREADYEHQHEDENDEHNSEANASPSGAQRFHPANAQLHDDRSRLAHRRRQQRTAAVEQHFTAAVDTWGAKRAARGGGARVHRSLQMAMDASTAVAGAGAGAAGGAASSLAMGGVRSSGGAGYSTNAAAAAAASASANLRGELLFDSDLEEDDDMGAEAFSFGLTSRIKAARTQFWDSVENISNHLTSLEIEYVDGSIVCMDLCKAFSLPWFHQFHSHSFLFCSD